LNKAIKAIVVCLILTLVNSLPSAYKTKEIVNENITGQIKNEEFQLPMTAILEPKVDTITIPEYKEVNLILTFYTSLPGETNGKGITASGKKIEYGMIACNQLPFGTQIETNEYGILTVEDKGSSKHFPRINDDTYRIDVFIPRNKDETNKQYKQRVLAMGVQRITGKILMKGD
jgi:3D (Asp-Asp-Asp) domain-containing protein